MPQANGLGSIRARLRILKNVVESHNAISMIFFYVHHVATHSTLMEIRIKETSYLALQKGFKR